MKTKLLSLIAIGVLFIGTSAIADEFEYYIKVFNNTDTIINAEPLDNMSAPICEEEIVPLSHGSSQTCEADPIYGGHRNCLVHRKPESAIFLSRY